MPAITIPVTGLALGPGTLYIAPIGTSLPADTVAGSVFTDAWASAGAWTLLGATDAGSIFNYQLNTDPLEVEEYYDPIQVVGTGRDVSLAAALASINQTNMKIAFNGGTTATTGTGATLLTTLTPPTINSEVRKMVGWEAQDNTERYVFKQCLQIGQLAVSRRKGAQKALLNLEFKIEQPTDGSFPFKYSGAGTVRA